MQKEIETIQINGVEYVKKDSIQKECEKLDGMEFCIIRSYDAGCFAGYIKEYDKDTRHVRLVNAIRLHQWYGASLSQLANTGTPDESKCRFASPTAVHVVANVIEIIPCTDVARKNLQGVKSWIAK